jgi:hypothetical protein
MFSQIDDFAEELVKGKRSARYSPLEVAAWLQGFAQAAAANLKKAEGQIADRSDPAFRRVAIDVTIQSGIGRFFAEKLQAGVSYALHRRTGDVRALQEALTFYRKARTAWAELAGQAAQAYVSDLSFGSSAHLRGHWADRLTAIDEDIQDVEKRLNEAAGEAAVASNGEGWTTAATRVAKGGGEPHGVQCKHRPQVMFRRGEPMTVELAVKGENGGAGVIAVRLHYRRVNQAETCAVVDMPTTGECFRATISGDYTNSPYPLQYWFELRDASGRAWFWPGFNAELSNQPYFVVRQARQSSVDEPQGVE